MSSRSLRSRAREWEADAEMKVGRGMARQSRADKATGLERSSKARRAKKLALGKAAAKTMVEATIKKNKARKGK